MKKLKCECGHFNPEGTVLCEACGKPIAENQHLDGNHKRKLLNMRYDGSARRSQAFNRSIIDKTWSFFSSVKVGVWLIVIALIASSLGTIFPQEMYIPADAPVRDPSIYYEAQHGILGKIYYQLGFHNLYSSWWYMILIALIGVSLVICSIDRFVPLYRALKMQRPKRHETFVNRQRLYSESSDIDESTRKTVVERLKAQRYNISEDNGHVLAEKGRFSRWGPYVNHIGLIIILIAALLRSTPLFYLDEYVWVREGETIVIPGTDREFYIENKEFILETYDSESEEDERFKEAIEKQEQMIAKNYQTNAVIYEAKDGSSDDLQELVTAEIKMNEPLKFSKYTLYQAGYQLNEFSTMSFKVFDVDDESEEALGEFTVDLTSPEPEYVLDNGLTVEVNNYFPDYYLDDGEPRSESKYPRNPAFVFTVEGPDAQEKEVNFIGIGRNIADESNQYKLGVIDFETRDVSGLTVRRDYTLPIFGLGALIFMIGVIQGMYWQHRRIWIHPKGDQLLMAAHTNKNWFGIQKDIEKAIKDTNIEMVIDQRELDSE